MSTVILVLNLLIFLLIFYARGSSRGVSACWRDSFLSAAVTWALISLSITEFLSLFSLITFNGILFSWGAVFIAGVFILLKLPHRKPAFMFSSNTRFSNLEVLSLFAIGCIILTVGLIALVAPPNNWDSLAYHMSRVFYWTQNHNVNYYPTHVPRQITFSPGAEYMILQLQALAGNDRFANLIQWFSMIGCIVGVSLIAKKLGADRNSQIFSALICATIPMGILQGSSTQNDYAAAFWIICFINFSLALFASGPSPGLIFFSGSSLGLALFTKGTAYLYTLPFLAWLILAILKNRHRNKLLMLAGLIAIPLFINIPHYARNFDLYRYPFAKINTTPTGMNPGLLISNLLRNMSSHMGSPSELINNTIYRLIETIHAFLGVSINDPRITWENYSFLVNFTLHEDTTGNPTHFLLAVVSVFVFVFSSKLKKQKNLLSYLIAAAASAVLLSIFIQWNRWGTRYHLPFFVIFAPLIAMVLAKTDDSFEKNRFLLILAGFLLCWTVLECARLYLGITPASYRGWFLAIALYLSLCLLLLYRLKSAMTAVSIILIVSSLPWILLNRTRSMIGGKNIFAVKRIEQYFANAESRKKTYGGAVDYALSLPCTDIGLIVGKGDWDYPFIAILRDRNVSQFRIEHVNVSNSSARYNTGAFKQFSPCAIITTKSGGLDKITCNGVLYKKQYSNEEVAVFRRDAEAKLN